MEPYPAGQLNDLQAAVAAAANVVCFNEQSAEQNQKSRHHTLEAALDADATAAALALPQFPRRRWQVAHPDGSAALEAVCLEVNWPAEQNTQAPSGLDVKLQRQSPGGCHSRKAVLTKWIDLRHTQDMMTF